MNEFTKIAILNAIKIEKASYDLYRLAANSAIQSETVELFNNLASEEFEHMVGFIDLYPGDKSEITSLINGISIRSKLNLSDLQTIRNCSDYRKQVLSIAMKEEQFCIDLYTTCISLIHIPEVNNVFKKALEETKQHFDTIEAEYACSMGMVNDSDINTYVRE
jgi:rubrerythrin